jgi:hypothetical protein
VNRDPGAIVGGLRLVVNAIALAWAGAATLHAATLL